MPRLVRLYVVQCAIGFGLSFVFVAALLALDVGHLRHLVTATQGGGVAVAMLLMFNGLVFAGVQFAITVMRMAEREAPPSNGSLQPIPVRISDRHR
jgi:hypothetical protein